MKKQSPENEIKIMTGLSEFNKAIPQKGLVVIGFMNNAAPPKVKAIEPQYQKLANEKPDANFYKVSSLTSANPL